LVDQKQHFGIYNIAISDDTTSHRHNFSIRKGKMETASEIAMRALTEKVTNLEQSNEQLRNELREAQQQSLEKTLGPLRLRGIVLLNTLTEQSAENRRANFQKLAEAFGTKIAATATQHMFYLRGLVGDELADKITSAMERGQGKT
jgi:hypothetical protein